MKPYLPYRPYSPYFAGAGGGIPSPSFSYFSFNAATYELDDTLASGRVAVINVPRDTGYYGQVPTTKVAYPKSRIEQNLALWSEDMANVAWTKYNCTVTATQITITGNYGSAKSLQVPVGGVTAHANMSFEARSISGNTTLHFLHEGSASGDYTPLTIDTVSRRYSITVLGSATGNVNFGIQDRTLIPGSVIEFTKIKVKVVDGQVDMNLPGEYIKTTNVRGVTRQFSCADGNTVNPTTHVVTEGVGALLDPQPYALSAPAATNSLTYSDDLTNAAWTKTNGAALKNAVGIMGIPNGACTLTASAANCTCIRASAFTAASGTHATRWYIKRKTGTGTVELTLNNGTTWQDITSQINAGAYVAACVDQAAVTNPQVGIRVVTSGDAVYISNTGLHMNKTKEVLANGFPIYTTTAAVTRDKDVIAAPLADLNQPSNSGYIEVNVAAGSTPNILGAFLSFDGTSYKLTDGTSTVSVAGTVGEHKLGWYAGPGGMNLCVDGVWGTQAAYDAILAAALGLFTNATYPQQFRNFLLWPSASKAAIDAMVAA